MQYSWLKNLVVEKIVPFDAAIDKLLQLDFTEKNQLLSSDILDHTEYFTSFITTTIRNSGARYGVGGYNEHRTVYARSKVFNAIVEGEEPRRLHLGIDIWGESGTQVFAPIQGEIHSFAFNDHFGDYGATIILKHEFNGITFHTLYGHLSLKDLKDLTPGKNIKAGELIAHFGEPAENGHWPPHLHFQLISDMEGKYGDYPGVCKLSEREYYLNNCPDPDSILRMMPFAVKHV